MYARILTFILIVSALITAGCGGYVGDRSTPKTIGGNPPQKPGKPDGGGGESGGGGNPEAPGENDGGNTPPSGPKLQWDSVRDLVFGSVNTKGTCLGCHSNQGGNKGRVNLETYTNVLGRLSTVRKVILDQDMPPVPLPLLSNYQIGLLEEWIANGAPEFSDIPLPQN